MARTRAYSVAGVAAAAVVSLSAVESAPAQTAARPRLLVPRQLLLHDAARRIMREDCRLVLRGDSHSTKGVAPRMAGGMMRTWDVRWKARVTQAENGDDRDGDMGLAYAPPGAHYAVRIPGTMFFSGEVGVLPDPSLDFAFNDDVADGEGFVRAYLSDRNLLHGPPEPTYLVPWTIEPLTARVIYHWSGGDPLSLVITGGRLPPDNPFTAMGSTVASDVSTAAQGPNTIGHFDIPVASGGGLPAVLLSARPGEVETGKNFHYGGTLFERAGGCFQLDTIASAGWNAANHLDPAKCSDSNLRGYYAATRRPNMFVYMLGHNDEGAGHTPAEYESHVRAMIQRDLSAATSPEVGLQGAELRWLLVCPWQFNLPLIQQYAARLYAIADNPPPEVARGQVGFVNLYEIFGGENPMAGGLDQLHFETRAEADRVTTAIWNELVAACPECTCQADCNGDGALNLADFGCFQTAFATGAPDGDCNDDGVFNLSDFGCFQTKFALGCP